MRDLLNDGDDITLTDIGLSSTAIPGYLLFIRLVPLTDLNTTSGFAFPFPGHMEKRLLAGYKQTAKKVDSRNVAQRRFSYFFQSYRATGIEVRME